MKCGQAKRPQPTAALSTRRCSAPLNEVRPLKRPQPSMIFRPPPLRATSLNEVRPPKRPQLVSALESRWRASPSMKCGRRNGRNTRM